MIVLDTNVVSELMRAVPHERVFAWVASRPARDLYVAAITQAEILHGIALLPSGARRTGLAIAAETVFSEKFAGRVLPFDRAAAVHYAAIRAARRATGDPIEGFDALIAATALNAGAAVATRDVDGFEGCGLAVVDPWST